jgi:dCMP deaminase
MSTQRISWEEYALKIAQVASLRSEDPFYQVGACALDYSNRVIGVAYNGLAPGKVAPDGFWEDRDKRRPYMVHAECNVLALIKRGECRLIACNLLPCSSCATNIVAHGIKKVVYSEVYSRDTMSLEIFKFNDIECVQLKV